jgi:PAS domain S-box-containing protein
VDVSTSLGVNLEASAQRTLERVYERLPVMMYAANSAGRIVDVNTYWLKRLGYKKEQVLGRSSADFMPAGDSQERRAVWAQLMRGEEVTDWQMQYVSAAGEVVDGLLYGAPVLNAKLELQGAIATVFDVTELRAAERARDQLETELRLSQKLEAIGQLAAGIAHEINTPVQYVSDNVQFLQRALADLLEVAQRAPEEGADLDLEYLASEAPMAADQAVDGLRRIADIVRAVKQFSHPGSDKPAPADLNAEIATTAAVSRNEWRYVADLTTTLDPDLPLVPCLADEIRQVLLNLIVNAAHAIAEAIGSTPGARGRIQVTSRRDGEWAEITVADTGTGIPEAVRSRVFDPFFTTKGVGDGTGQGLAIARAIVVEKHRGVIRFETAVGQGTTFIVRLPLQSPTDGKARAA